MSNAFRKAKMGRVLSKHQWFAENHDLHEALRRENERRKVERQMQEQDNLLLMRVNPLENKYSLQADAT